jgi:hypothetical protein
MHARHVSRDKMNVAMQHRSVYFDRGLTRRAMTDNWQTKYGSRRVRRDPPTLEEAIYAAMGITDDLEAQAEIAASLMGLPVETVQPEVKKNARIAARSTRVIAGEQGAQRSVVVERRVSRRIIGNDKRF